MSTDYNLVFHEDPGHGWLAVPVFMLVELDIHEKISQYSYICQGYAYLEEDLDLTVFMNAVRERSPGETVRQTARYHGGRHWIRDLPNYTPKSLAPNMPKEIRIDGSELFYRIGTSPDVVRIIENHYNVHRSIGPAADRLIFVYGDTETGKSWSEPPNYYGSTDVGRVSASTGPMTIPLAIYNSRSTGGSAIATSSIVKILTARGKREIYTLRTDR